VARPLTTAESIDGHLVAIEVAVPALYGVPAGRTAAGWSPGGLGRGVGRQGARHQLGRRWRSCRDGRAEHEHDRRARVSRRPPLARGYAAAATARQGSPSRRTTGGAKGPARVRSAVRRPRAPAYHRRMPAPDPASSATCLARPEGRGRRSSRARPGPLGPRLRRARPRRRRRPGREQQDQPRRRRHLRRRRGAAAAGGRAARRSRPGSASWARRASTTRSPGRPDLGASTRSTAPTTSCAGTPGFCVSIGLVVDGDSVLGVIYDSVDDAVYWAVRGGGAHRDGVRLRRPPQRALERTRWSAPTSRRSRPARRGRPARVRRAGAARRRRARERRLLPRLLPASRAGRTDLFWQFDLKSWDVAAGAVPGARGGRRGVVRRRPGRLGAGAGAGRCSPDSQGWSTTRSRCGARRGRWPGADRRRGHHKRMPRLRAPRTCRRRPDRPCRSPSGTRPAAAPGCRG
jgi:hypothetical protein